MRRACKAALAIREAFNRCPRVKTDQTPFFVKQIPEDRSALLRIRNYPMNLCAIHLHDGCFLWMSNVIFSSISGQDDSMPASIP